MFTAQGPGGIFGLYATTGVHLGYVFLNEFVCVSRCPQTASNDFWAVEMTPHLGLHPGGRHLRLHRPDKSILPSRPRTMDHWIHIVGPLVAKLPMMRLMGSAQRDRGLGLQSCGRRSQFGT